MLIVETSLSLNCSVFTPAEFLVAVKMASLGSLSDVIIVWSLPLYGVPGRDDRG